MNLLFDHNLSFEKKALSVFKYQALECPIYSEYLNLLKIDIQKVNSIEAIPCLPIEFFKSHRIISRGKITQKIFTSSGTDGQKLSQHHIADLSIYEQSFIKGFEQFYGNPKDYRILALLPSYLEREGSSLVYMCQHLINLSQHSESGFYLNNLKELSKTLQNNSDTKTILIGVSYALLDLAEQYPQALKNTIIMETGGMKGKRTEILKAELHQILKSAFELDTIHSEYGMTELLSQAYSKGNGIFKTPPWMKIIIRDLQDPISIVQGSKTGGINIIDLANIYSCSFIATEDLGQINHDNTFELKGRMYAADIRGCNLLIQ